ncbi:MAG TPA: serine hydrolase [Steroidobacteraceae bacterium]|nr:serine hydrolase [Steroidobacteraceae bacterium]
MHRSPLRTAAVLAALALLLGVLAAYGPALWRTYLEALARRSAPLYQPRERVAGGNEPVAPRVAPALEQLDPQALESAASYAGAHGSRALIVARHDHIVFERYWGGSKFDTVSDGQDFTALLAVLATGVAVSHRSIPWPDEPLSLLLAEWREDPRGAITVRNLMQRSSGLASGADLKASADLTTTVLGIPLVQVPGSTRVPEASDAQLLALALERATGERYAQYVSSALWRRLGAADAYLWLDHPGGAAHADCCMFARQGDWIRVAQLLVRDGAYRGQQLMRPGWVTFMRTPARSDADFGSFVRVSLRPSARSEPYAARDAFAVGEEGGNRMWIVPSLQLAIVCTGPSPGRAADWDEVRIPNLIIGAARDQLPAAAPPGKVSALVPGH